MKIGMFDSGIGGLNVLKEVIQKYPNNIYYYYGDTKNLPYGNKDKETLLKLSTEIIKFFEKKQVDIIIIACGTVSANCYFELKKRTTIPLYNIITPTINYLKACKAQKIAVIGTEKTIASHIFQKQFRDILEIATPEFVPMIEENNLDKAVVKKYLLPVLSCDYLVLGCTHYPLLLDIIKEILNEKVQIVDMGKCLIQELVLKNDTEFSLDLYFTKMNSKLNDNIKKILKVPYKCHVREG